MTEDLQAENIHEIELTDAIVIPISVSFCGEMARDFRLVSQMMESLGRTPTEVVAYLLYEGVRSKMEKISKAMELVSK